MHGLVATVGLVIGALVIAEVCGFLLSRHDRPCAGCRHFKASNCHYSDCKKKVGQ